MWSYKSAGRDPGFGVARRLEKSRAVLGARKEGAMLGRAQGHLLLSCLSPSLPVGGTVEWGGGWRILSGILVSNYGKPTKDFRQGGGITTVNFEPHPPSLQDWRRAR